jgi:hypothetical protein
MKRSTLFWLAGATALAVGAILLSRGPWEQLRVQNELNDAARLDVERRESEYAKIREPGDKYSGLPGLEELSRREGVLKPGEVEVDPLASE